MVMDMLITFLLIGLGGVLVIAFFVLIARKFASIAEMKGHQGYFWWCLLLGAVGWAMVIALPDRKIQFPDYSKLIASAAKQEPAPGKSEPDDRLPRL